MTSVKAERKRSKGLRTKTKGGTDTLVTTSFKSKPFSVAFKLICELTVILALPNFSLGLKREFNSKFAPIPSLAFGRKVQPLFSE